MTAIGGLAGVYQAEGKNTDALALDSNVAELRRRLLGPDHPDTLMGQSNVAELYRRLGKYDQAEKLLVSVAGLRRRVLGPQHRDTVAALRFLGRVRIEHGQYAKAEPPLREALSIYEKTTPDIWQRYQAQNLLGASLAGQSIW